MRWLWWICITLLILFLIAAGFVGGAHFNVGSRTFRCVCQPANDEKDLFFRSGWDGPTGEFTSCDIYGVRVWKWVLRLDIVSDPIGAAKRRLPSSIEGLIAAIDSKDHWRRACALQRLAELGEAAAPAIPALLKQLPRNDADAHETLAAISKATPATAVPLLTNAMTTGDVTTRCHLVEILTDIGPPASAAIPVLTERLRDSDGQVVIRCAFALSKIGGGANDAVPVLRTLLNSPDSELRAGAVTALNEFGAEGSAATPEIIRLLDDSNLDVRAMAARTLAAVRRGSDQIADNIPSTTLTRLDSLARGDDIAAQWAIDALSTMGTNGARILADIYKTAEPARRREAADALIKLGPQTAATLPMLMADLAGTDTGRTHQSARIIGSIGQRATNAITPLTQLLQHDSALIRVQAARAIWKIDHRAGTVLPVLVAELKSEALGNGRRFAAEALGEMGPAAAETVPLLKTILNDARPDVRQAAADALKKIGTTPQD